MNKQFKLLILLTIVTTAIQAQKNEWKYLNQLPKDSILLAQCEESRGFLSSYLGIRNETEGNCNCINSFLEYLTTLEEKNKSAEEKNNSFRIFTDLILAPAKKVLPQDLASKVKKRELKYLFDTAEKLFKESSQE